MTLPASGYLLLGADGGASGRSINSEFGYGNDLASYRGAYYGKGTQEFQFPTIGNPINMQLFYSTFKIPSGSGYLPTGYWTVPVYTNLDATVVGGSGGQAGSYGYNACGGYPTGSAGGSSGSSSSFGGYLSAGGGAGGTGSGGGGANGASAVGSWKNPVQGGSGPTSGTVIYVTVGGGGAGGAGGPNCAYYGPYCLCPNNAATGATGASGSVYVSWS